MSERGWCSGAGCEDGTACGAVDAWFAAIGEARAAAEVAKIATICDTVAALGRAVRIRTPPGVCHVAYLLYVHNQIGARPLVAVGHQNPERPDDNSVEVVLRKTARHRM